jgi:ATP-binding cassette subfamily G (WHITE) protein 2
MQVYELAGYPCPVHMNPAEHLLDVITPELGTVCANADEAVDKLRGRMKDLRIDLAFGSDKPDLIVHEPITWSTEVYTLFHREMKTQLRNWEELIINVLLAVVLALFVGGVFTDIGTDQESRRVRLPSIFFVVISQGVAASLQGTHAFPLEREIVLRERAAGSYHVSSYFLAKTFAEMAVRAWPAPLAFAFTCYFVIGYRPGVSHFCIFALFLVLCQVAATSLAVAVSAICRTITLSVTIMPLAFELARLFGGFFLPPADMPDYFKFVEYLVYSNYAFIGAALNELRNLDLHCTESQLKSDGTCAYTSGNQDIEDKGYDKFSIGGCIGALLVYIAMTKFVAYLALRYIKW